MGTWGSVFKPAQCKNGKEWNKVDNIATFLHPTPKYPAGQKYQALSIPLNAQLGEMLWDMGQHGTTIKWKIFSILPKNTQLPQKYPALSTQQNTQLGVLLDMGQHGITITWKKFLHPTLKNPSASTYPALSRPKIHSLGFSNLTSLILWDHYKMEKLSPSDPKIPISVDTNTPSLESFCRHPLASGHDSMGPL